MTGFERTTAPVTRTQIVRFAGAAGDFNPMHHDEPFAQATGQPSVFAMGQLTAAIVGSAVAGWLGRENVAAYGVRFKHNVLPGDRLVLRAQPAGDRWELSARREDDDTVRADRLGAAAGRHRIKAKFDAGPRAAYSGTRASESAIRSS